LGKALVHTLTENNLFNFQRLIVTNFILYETQDKIKYDDEPWVFPDSLKKNLGEISGPLEYRQTLGRILNGLIENNFVVIKMLEWAGHDQNLNAEAGDWEHCTSYLPPWLCFWTLNRPDLTFTVS